MSAAREHSHLSVDLALARVLRASAAGVADSFDDAAMDTPDGVHRHRSAVRRLRAVLAALRPLWDGAAVAPVEAALRRWGGELGVVRDAEVHAMTAEHAMIEAGIDDDDMRVRIVERAWAAHGRAHGALMRVANLERTTHLIRELTRWSTMTDPPLTSGVDWDSVAERARREARRVLRAAKRSDQSTEDLHRLRKAARRLRYTADALSAVAPDELHARFHSLAKRAKRVQSALGTHRDHLLFAEELNALETRARRHGESTEPYVRLRALARSQARAAIKPLDDRVAALRKAARRLP